MGQGRAGMQIPVSVCHHFSLNLKETNAEKTNPALKASLLEKSTDFSKIFFSLTLAINLFAAPVMRNLHKNLRKPLNAF